MENILSTKLTGALSPTVLEIVNESDKHAGHTGSRPGGNTHFRLKIVSAQFESLSRLERHRLVHNILKEELEDPIHALSLKLLTPQEVSHDT